MTERDPRYSADNLIWIDMQDNAAWEAFLEFSYQVCLELVLQHNFLQKIKRSIASRDAFSSLHKRACIFRDERRRKKAKEGENHAKEKDADCSAPSSHK